MKGTGMARISGLVSLILATLKAADIINALFCLDIACVGLFIAFVDINTIPAIGRQLIAFETRAPDGSHIGPGIVTVMGTGRSLTVSLAAFVTIAVLIAEQFSCLLAKAFPSSQLRLRCSFRQQICTTSSHCFLYSVFVINLSNVVLPKTQPPVGICLARFVPKSQHFSKVYKTQTIPSYLLTPRPVPKSDLRKTIRCYSPSKPEGMPQDVYEKYKISSRYLSDQDRRTFWQKFAKWWQNVFETPTTTPAPPTPSHQRLNKDNKLICVEYDETNGVKRTTRIYEIDMTSTVKPINELITTLSPSPKTTTKATTLLLKENDNKVVTSGSVYSSDSTPFDPSSGPKDKNQMMPDMDQKARTNLNIKMEIKNNHDDDDNTYVKTD
ncbi:unnamed protein product [Medioppia subpectinata]|uniref:Uncharacterized protein n=1 Tax=Medioppia subpectinata TaxID=1979941 RepID=A0A7R9Q4X9_9ACAR|nr:unnamed protein product [Medioppia subpectinata]CAG2111818.1 unnamed protein product [Medioppia subpectinata]